MNIYWKDIVDTDLVVDKGHWWMVGDAVVFWHGQDAVAAHRMLDHRVKLQERKILPLPVRGCKETQEEWEKRCS
jgi:hypothetical protein